MDGRLESPKLNNVVTCGFLHSPNYDGYSLASLLVMNSWDNDANTMYVSGPNVGGSS